MSIDRTYSKILVLGSNSFGGASLVNVALDMGYQVFGISRSIEPQPAIRAYSKNKNLSAFQFKQLDLNNDLNEIETAIKNFRPEMVIDFAGQGMVAPSWQTPEQWYQTNIVAKVRLHKLMEKFDFLDCYLRVSTPEVYGNTQELIKENATYAPSTPYAVSHAAIDMSLEAFFKQNGFPVILTRFANFYGPFQQLYRIIPKTLLSALGQGILTLDGGGKSTRAFIHGKDVASGILSALTHGQLGEIYHFSTDEFVSIKDIVSQIAELVKTPVDTFSKVGPERPGKDAAYFMDFQKAKNELKWQPEISLSDGLEDCLKWVHDHMEDLKTLPQSYHHKA